MFSLSYLPTAERLTVVIVKARNIRIPSTDKVSASSDLQNVFVKVRHQTSQQRFCLFFCKMFVLYSHLINSLSFLYFKTQKGLPFEKRSQGM